MKKVYLLHLGTTGYFEIPGSQIGSSDEEDETMQVGDPSGTAVDRFLKWVEDPACQSAILDAALPRQWNKDILGVLVPTGCATSFISSMIWLESVFPYSRVSIRQSYF